MSLASRDWNDMSSSSSDQSNQDTNQPKDNTQTELYKTQNVKLPVASSTKPLQSVQQQKEEVHNNNNKDKGQGGEKKMMHLTDEQLLAEYVNKRVDDAKVIRVTACHHQQYKNILNNLTNARVKQIKDGFFILYFQSEQALLDFFREKMQKKYRFYFLPYMKRKQNGEYRSREQGRYQNHENGKRQKKEYVLRGQRQHDLIVKEGEKIQEKEEEVQPEKRVEEEKIKRPTFIERQHFQIEKMMNVLHIDNSLFDVERAIKELEGRRVFKDFNKVVIKTPPQAIQKVSKLCFQIGQRKKFYLDKQPPLEGPIIELMLIENGKDSQTRQFYEHHSGQIMGAYRQKDKDITKDIKKVYESKDQQQRKQNKQTILDRYQKDEKELIQQRHQKEQIEIKQEDQRANKQKKTENKDVVEQKSQGSSGRRLGSKYNEYFQNVANNNLSTLVNGFDENEYIKRLKDESANIDKNWNSWKVQADDDNIQALLKLVHRLKKSTIYNVQLLPSLRNQKALLTAELKPRPEKQRRPKVDVSSVNGYLS